MALYLLLETHSGFSLFQAHGLPSVGHDKDAVLASLLSFPAFSDLVRLVSFLSFPSPADALRQRKAIAEGFMSDGLKKFLEDNLPKVGEGEKPSYSVGVADARMGYRIAREFQILCKTDDFVLELLLGICIYFHSFIDNAESTSAETAELRLGCSRMRAKVRLDSLIVHATSRSRTLAEEIASLSEMIRERYSWHFPELGNIIKNHYLYAKVAKVVENRSEFSQDHIPKLGEVLGDEQIAHQIFEAAKDSKGLDLSTVDLINIQKFGRRVEDLSKYMKKLSVYLVTEMNDIAPNLTFLIGEIAAVQLISCAGSLLNLAKLPSSSLQMLPARARGMRGKPRKFIFPSLFDQALASGKCRYLANKCVVAARIDCFSDKRKKQLNTKIGPEAFIRKRKMVHPEENNCKKRKEERFNVKIDDDQKNKIFIWEKPPSGWMKLNSDGSKDTAVAGYGGIIRDEEGMPLLLYSDHCLTTDQVDLIELQGALAGLEYAVGAFGNGIKLWLELDNIHCVKLISKKAQPSQEAQVFLEKIWSITTSLTDFWVSHIWREGNCAADLLAKPTLRVISASVVHSPCISNLHPALLAIVNDERSGKIYSRYTEGLLNFTFYPLGMQKEKEINLEQDQKEGADTKSLERVDFHDIIERNGKKVLLDEDDVQTAFEWKNTEKKEANQLAPAPNQFVENQAGVKMYREVAQTVREAVSQVAVAQNVLINGDQLQDAVNRMDTGMDVQPQVESENFVPLCKTSSSPISSSLRSSASLGKEPNIKSPFRDFRPKKKPKCSLASDNSDRRLTGVIRCFIGGMASLQEEKGTGDGVTSSQVEERGTGEGVTTYQAAERETCEGVASSQVEGRETGVCVTTSQTAERGPCKGVTTSQVAEMGTGEGATTSQAAEMGTGGGVTTSQVEERGTGEGVTSSQEAERETCEGVASQVAREGNQGLREDSPDMGT